MTVRRARIMWELHLPLLMLAQLSLNKARPDKVITIKHSKETLPYNSSFRQQSRDSFIRVWSCLNLLLR